ncbi:MAG: endoproteinase ArgC [Comamonadaceae bacterium]|nr:MAG: endoproteinase ArgC [Comamonadaceae bacterium]
MAIAAAAATFVLASCGGGGGGSSDSSSDNGGTGNTGNWSTTGSAAVNTKLRIESLDSAAKRSAAAATQAGAVASALSPAAQVSQVVLDAPADRTLDKAGTGIGKRQAIGMARSVAATAGVADAGALLKWATTANGTQAAAIRFTSADAVGVRLGVLVRGLPDGAVLRFHGDAAATAESAAVETITAEQARATIERNLNAGIDDVTAHTLWSRDFGGSATTLEIEIPAGTAARSQLSLAVPQLSHLVTTAQSALTERSIAKVGESESCNVDVSCDASYDAQSRSVALMEFVDNGKTFVCTGTLLNDAAGSGTPYFLSANHCISAQSEASTLVTRWFYRSTSCNASSVNPGTQTVTGGATLLYQADATDVSFLRLNAAPPAGALYAGSYFGEVATGAGLAGIHHPSGDLQKLSVGTLTGAANCTSETCTETASGSFLRLNWQQGTTQGGSSGSSVLHTVDGKRYVVGQLLGGVASCSNRGGNDYYGRYEQSYKAALYRWLNP